MFLPTKDGIMCDLCGTSHKDSFEYYASETTKIKVVNNQKIMRADAKFTKDVCPQCYEDLLTRVREHISVFKTGHIKCDLSNTYKRGTFDYYEMVFDKIVVDKSANPSTIVDKKVMDLNLITGFDDLVKRAQVISDRNRNQGVWS